MDRVKDRLQVAKALYRLIERESAFAALKDLLLISQSLSLYLDGDNPRSLGTDLSLWVGLKCDTPEMGEDYGRSLTEEYPELLKN